jgi:hypothetical protein
VARLFKQQQTVLAAFLVHHGATDELQARPPCDKSVSKGDGIAHLRIVHI